MMNPAGAGFLLLFVASRLLYLVLIDPSSLLIHPNDELYVGTIAQELVTGLTLPFAEYRETHYALGTLVMGAIAAGFFLLFGPTVFALKLAPLLFFTLALVFWFLTLQRHASERVALYFALLFCFSPPPLTAYSVAALGGHAESILFSALTVFLLFSMLPDDKCPLWCPALLGLTAGFGLWFAYIYGLTLLAMLGFWVWHDKGRLWRPRVLWFALGFVVGFAPWIIINVQSHFAGLVIYGTNVWEHFGLEHLWDGLAHPRRLALYEFFATIASTDPRDLPRRAVNLLYALLYLGPILTAGVLRLKTGRSAPAETGYRGRGPREMRPSRTHPIRPTLVGFASLYLAVFALAVQFSDFRGTRFTVPAYPFLFFLTAYSLARCQDLLPRVQRQIQTVFLASVVVLGLGTHVPLLSLVRPGAALSAKGYSYAWMPEIYVETHTPAGSDERTFLLEVVQRPFLSSILPKLSSDDQRDLANAIALLLAEAAPLNGQAEDFARFERVVPPRSLPLFYYAVGGSAIGRSAQNVEKAAAAVKFLEHRSPIAHHLALVGIYRGGLPPPTALDRPPEALVTSPAAVAPELSPHYWRTLGYRAGRYWHDTDRSLSLLHAHLQAFVPRLDPSVQRPFLQGVGELLFDHLIYIPWFLLDYSIHISIPWVAPADLERFPHAYQEGLLEGWGMKLGEYALFSQFPWKGQESLLWLAATKGLSAKSLVSVRRGKAQFDALFEGPASSALKPPLSLRSRLSVAGNSKWIVFDLRVTS